MNYFLYRNNGNSIFSKWGINRVTSRNWVKLFMMTLLIGGVVSGFAGFITRWGEFVHYFTDFKILPILSTFIWFFGMGLMFSVLSQMGFFAYLTVHRFGLGIFKTVSLWNAVQVFLIAFILFDLVYFRYQAFAKAGESILPYLGLAFLILIPSLVVAYIKAKETNKEAFVPAVFFMAAVTILELVPVLRVNEHSWLYTMLFSLLFCNAYQVLILHKLNEKSLQERKQSDQKSSMKAAKGKA